MITLIADNYQLIQVMSRFGIPMGFGDKTVTEVCDDAGVDCNTFLTVVNFVMDGYNNFETSPNVSAESLLHYLKQSHIYFLEYCLPAIRRKLLDSIKLRESDVSFLIIKLFDEYVNEVRSHMEYEEMTVFKYVRALLNGDDVDNYHITTYSDHHEQVGSKLKELKTIIIKYCPRDASINLLNAALYDIYRCEEELGSHCQVEDCLLVPAIMKLERQIAKPV
ncbi:MAG: hemerythrin domain-containing protein [Bacteroides sp.]|nr:hemerythrin domain-containing protein [Bacteroides sp.]MBD5357261.1 hemerythrin domain-containing protein [Bacteroides sp.]